MLHQMFTCTILFLSSCSSSKKINMYQVNMNVFPYKLIQSSVDGSNSLYLTIWWYFGWLEIRQDNIYIISEPSEQLERMLETGQYLYLLTN